MRKPGTPTRLRTLAYSVKSGLYEISEEGITYGMELEMTRQMKKYFSNNSTNAVKDWYQDLIKSDKDKIVRTGEIQEDGDIFYYND